MPMRNALLFGTNYCLLLYRYYFQNGHMFVAKIPVYDCFTFSLSMCSTAYEKLPVEYKTFQNSVRNIMKCIDSRLLEVGK